jgi:hypothetical protein
MSKDRNFNKEFINGLNNHKGQTLTKNSKPIIYDKKSSTDKHSGNTHCSYISTIHAKSNGQSELKNRLSTRIRSKYVTNEFILPLIDLNSPLKKAYWNTWHCSNIILQEGQTLTSKYCKNRWCLVCNRIKTAELILAYGEELNNIENKAFLTLSRASVPANELNAEISLILKEFGQIINSLEGKGRCNKIKGIRKIETTFNLDIEKFHPHIHGIFNFEDAIKIKKKWFELCNKKGIKVSHKGNQILPANEGSILEIFKYCTKLFKIDRTQKDYLGRQIINIDLKPLDLIFQSLKGRRTFSAYGLKKQKFEKITDFEKYDFLDSKNEIWKWEQKNSNYTDAINETLTNDNYSKVYNVQIR